MKKVYVICRAVLANDDPEPVEVWATWNGAHHRIADLTSEQRGYYWSVHTFPVLGGEPLTR